MGIVKCLINADWSCLEDWGVSNVVWSLVEIAVVGLLIKGALLPLCSALYVASKILRNNRGELGRGYGTKAADLFLTLWSSDRRFDDTEKEFLGNGSRIFIMGNIAERHLVPLRLAEVYTDRVEVKKVRVVKNFRNRTVKFIVQTIKNITAGV